MDKQEIKRAYKQSKKPMGVYSIRIAQQDKTFIGFSVDLGAIFNRHKTELKFKSHRNKELQEMWNTFGESAFEFEVIDILENADKSRSEINEELRTLMEMWIQKLEDTGVITVRI